MILKKNKFHGLLFLLIILIFSLVKGFSVDTSKRFILDNKGRFSIFHGVNVVMKLPPYIPDTEKFDPYMSINTEYDLKTMKRLGFNMVRLGVIWEAVEKEPGVYDQDYLNKVEKIINTLGENGIYTMVDAHQDVFSRNFCGEGVPPFYVREIGYDKKCDASFLSRVLGIVNVCKTLDDFGYRYDENGLPLVEDCKTHDFSQYHFLAELSSAYKHFYLDVANIQEKFVEFWKTVAKKLKGNQYVLGYDLWNEPFPGGFLENVANIIPGRADTNMILPVYKKVDKAIREIDENYILFFENTPFPDTLPIFGGLVWGHMKEKPAPEDKPQVYNIHSYCCLAGGDACQNGEAPYSNSVSICPKYHNKKINGEIDAAKDVLNVPVFLSEFGACSDSMACYNEIMNVVTLCEKNLVSWAYWNYKPYGDHTTSAIELVEYEGIFNRDGTVQNIKERGLSRAYVQYYQGKPIDFQFENNSEVNFETSFEYDKTISEPSVLYYNKDWFYKKGFNIEIINDETKEDLIKNKAVIIDDKTANYIFINANSDLLLDGTKVRIYFKGI